MVNDLYIRQGKSVLESKDKTFIYRVEIFCLYKNHYSLVNSVCYSVNQEIPNIVEHFKRDSHTIITAELLSAPFVWLIENYYTKYIKPDKKVKKLNPIENDKPQVLVTKQGSVRSNDKTSRTRTKKP